MAGEATASDGDQEAVRAYAAACRARVPSFAARHFGWRGTLRLHRFALGWDLLRAPLNVLLVGPTLLLRLAALTARRFGLPRVARWLGSRHLFLETCVARRVAELVLSELLQVDRGAPWLTPEWHQRARRVIAEYVDARHALAEFGAGFVALIVGVLLLHALTPSAITLGPMLARELAQQDAIAGFWLGAWAGSIWYEWFPAGAGWMRTIATTATVMGCFALLATFMGLLVDPLLQWAGLHRRRLTHLIGTLERVALGDHGARLGLPDLYVARLTDIVDVVLLTARFTR